jgi:germination protein M
MKRLTTITAAVAVLALLLVGCGGGVVDGGPVADDTESAAPTEEPATTDEPADEPTDEPADTDEVTDDTETTEPEDTEPADDATEPEPTEEPGTDPTEPATDEDDEQTTAVTLYYLAPGGENPGRAGPFLVAVEHRIPATQRIALATLRELFEGPTAGDEALVAGVSTAIPSSALVLDVGIVDGLATVDLSREFESGGGSFSMFARLAQVVYTVSQWPTVDEVAFELDGQPVTVFSGEGIVLDGPVSRADYYDLLPGVFVDSPAAGATLASGDRVTGMAAVFEATFLYRLEDAEGTVLAEGFEMTDNGMGWGAFDFALPFDVDGRQPGLLTVWEASAKDGSDQSLRVTPVVLAP